MADIVQPNYDFADRFGISSPAFVLTLIPAYLAIVLKICPKYMRGRKAFNLKKFIIIYNTIQVLSCLYIVTTILHIEPKKLHKFWLCSYYGLNSPEEKKFHVIAYFTFWLKIIELSETVVFVLRKKQNQVSFLHVFHHSATLMLVYSSLKYQRGGAPMYPLFLNSCVHIIMYSYYLAAAVFDNDTMTKLTPIKKSITVIQMIQFVLILLQVACQAATGCKLELTVVTFYVFAVSVIFYMFYDFYKKAYNKPMGISRRNVSAKKL